MNYTIDEIIHLTGIPANKAVEICNLLCAEGYLDYDGNEGTYNLTDRPDLLEFILRVKNQLLDVQKQEQIYDKIEDIITLGKPLALSDKESERAIKDIGIAGLNIIFSGPPSEEPPPGEESPRVPGLPRGHCLLVKGAPGTGKTTLGMQIALHLKAKNYRTLFLTFEEEVEQLVVDLKPYCLEKDDEESGLEKDDVVWKEKCIRRVTRSLRKFLTPSAWNNADQMLRELCAIFDKELPQLVVIDSVSRFREVGGEVKARPIIRRLIRTLKIRGITTILLGEEKGETHGFEEYEVDGLIRLKWEGDQLALEVNKMRGLKAYKGPHSAALITVDDFRKRPEHKLISDPGSGPAPDKLRLQTGFNVFPAISVFKDYFQPEKKAPDPEPLDTGIESLNKLLPLKEDSKGFKKGESIILIGSAGSGKTILALNFMLQGFKERGASAKERIAVWINLEGDIGTLRFAVSGFEEDEKNNKFTFKEMLRKAEEEPKDSYFKFFSFPPINLDMNKILYILAALHNNYEIDRLVIDSVTELERAKSGPQPDVKVFLAGLIQFLRDRNITTMFICRSDTFFRSIDRIEEQILSLVDLIICIRNFDMRNQIHKGIYIQKARGRKHNSKIMRLIIDSKAGIKIEDSGWDVEHLLAGDTSNIQPPKVFFKLFYENPAETFVNNAIVNDFDKERYPGEEPVFREVKKSSIHTEFWSFRGQYSAGHANTRVLSIADHVISAFRDNKRLTELKHYVKGELIKNIGNDPYLLRLFDPKTNSEERQSEEKEDREYEIDAIPGYRDFGVMVFKEPTPLSEAGEASGGNNSIGEKNQPKSTNDIKNAREKLISFLKDFAKLTSRMDKRKNEAEDEVNDSMWLPNENSSGEESKSKTYTWERLGELIKACKCEEQDRKKRLPYAFAFPPLDKKSEFIAFFMELLWSFGGDIYDIPIYEGYSLENYREMSKKRIEFRILFDLQECCELLKPAQEEQSTSPGKNHSEMEPVESLKAFIKSLKDEEPEIKDGLKSRFSNYGIIPESQNPEKFFEEFISWLDKFLTKKEEENKKIEYNVEAKPAMSWDSPPFQETLKLIFRLIYDAGVISPIHGDYREDALLSRHWYSHLCIGDNREAIKCLTDSDEPDIASIEKEIKKKFAAKELLPLPLAKIVCKGNDGKPLTYYRSVTCVTYWCLVMLQDALSPEIGGNFIESLVAPEYYKGRLSIRAGMPAVNLELGKQEYIDNDEKAYALMRRIVANGEAHEELNKALSENLKAKKYCTKEKRNGDGNESPETIATILKQHSYVRFDLLKQMDAGSDREESNADRIKKEFENIEESALSTRMFFPKYRQTRIGFYHIEQALHQQIRNILMLEIKGSPSQTPTLVEMQQRIATHLATLYPKNESLKKFSKPKGDSLDSSLLKLIINEFRLHAILEILTSFYKEDELKK